MKGLIKFKVFHHLEIDNGSAFVLRDTNALINLNVLSRQHETLVMQKLGLIKICPDPHCEAIYHNIPKSHTKCGDCGCTLIWINEKTYWKKFSNNFFQYDFQTGEYIRPVKTEAQLSLDFV